MLLPTTDSEYPFLKGGGEMGHLTRTHNWVETALGTPDTWPPSLRTTLGIVLHSAFPMFLFWGDELTCFYNDAFRPSLGINGKHPAIGKPAKEVWPEIWDFIGPLIGEVMTTGEPVFFKDQLITIHRNGRLEDAYWTFSYSPAFGDDGQIGGVFVTCTETTEKVNTISQLQHSEQRFQNLVRDASMGIIVLDGEAMTVAIVNEAYARLIDRRADELLGKPIFSIVPEAEEVFRPILDTVRQTGESLHQYGQSYSVQNVDGATVSGFADVVYQPYREQDGTITGVMVLVQDVTEQQKAQKTQHESDERFRIIIELAPVAVAVFSGLQFVVTLANESVLEFWGRQREQVMNKPLFEALPEAARQGFEELLTGVYTTGQRFEAKEATILLERKGQVERIYFDFVYEAIRAPDGIITGVMVVAVETTDQVLARKAIEESEQHFRELTDSIPGIIWETRADGYCTYLNKQWCDLTGQTPAEAGGFGWLDATHPDDKAEAGRLFSEANATQTPFSLVYRLRQKDGSYRWAIDQGNPRFGADGTYEGMVGSVVDIHNQKLAEQELTRFQYMAENASDPFILMRADGTFAYLNQLALDRWGYTADEARHIRVLDVDPIYNDDVFAAAFARAQQEEIPPFETLHQRKDGSIYPVEVNMGGLLLNGEPHLFAVARDITERKQTDEALRASEAKLQSVVDTAPVAIGLFMGRDLVIELPNQTFIDIVGKGNNIAGKPLREVMPELITENQPFLQILDDVYTSGKPFHSHGSMVQIVQQGVMTHNYYNITYTPLFNDAGEVYAILDIAVDVTEQVTARQKIERSQQELLALFEQSPVGITIIQQENLTFGMANSFYSQLIGRTPDQLIGKPLLEALPELEGQGFDELLNEVFRTGIPFVANELPVQLMRNGRLETIYLDFTYQPQYNLADTDRASFSTILVVCVDVTQQVLARQKIEEAETKLRSLISNAPAAIGLFMGRDLIIDLPNQTFIDVVAKGPDIAGKPLREVMPELESQPFLQLLDQVYTSGEQFQSFGSEIKVVQQGEEVSVYYNLTYTPLFNEAGDVYAILNIGVDVAGQVLAQQALQKSEQNLRSMVESAPFPIGVYTGREMRIELANQSILDVWGKGNDVIGKLYAEILPELDNQQIFDQLAGVYTTGIPFHVKNQRVDLVVDGNLQPYYFNYSFTPLFDAAGQVYGVMNTAADITDLAIAKLQVEDAEAALRGAVELAQLGTWSIDAATNGITFSDRLIEWFGYDANEQAYSEVIPILEADDQKRVETAVAWALNPASDGVYNEVYTVIHPKTGKKRILHAQGKTVFDATGKAVRMNGTAQDITIQRELQFALENEVQQRTQQLQASVQDLERSNQNLKQFAYVASHDLQEPLRKIQSFGDLLKSQYAGQLGEGVDHLNRMQLAAGRMSTLIRDLLSYSRISTQQEATTPVSLPGVVQTVLSDLNLGTAETAAQVVVDSLPTVPGDPSQLGQLFQNLLSNALKFRKPDTVPSIRVSCQRVAAKDLPASVRPARVAKAYYRIDVIDNGIGFDEQYLDRIFQVFQRLHGKNEFAGTGIGLAICQKVAANHGGAITATSQPGEGATFSVYLPV